MIRVLRWCPTIYHHHKEWQPGPTTRTYCLKQLESEIVPNNLPSPYKMAARSQNSGKYNVGTDSEQVSYCLKQLQSETASENLLSPHRMVARSHNYYTDGKNSMGTEQIILLTV